MMHRILSYFNREEVMLVARTMMLIFFQVFHLIEVNSAADL